MFKQYSLIESLEQRVFLAVNWTVMVYMDADNNLESYGLMNLNQMESVTLPTSVNVVAEVDRIRGYAKTKPDWTDTRRGKITHDTNTKVLSSNLTSIGEKDMGDPNTLIDFINWSIQTYPASHYALVVWDHGGGLSGTCWDDTNGSDNLTVAEMTGALNAVKPNFEAQGTKLDMVGFDVCLAGLTEQYYDLASLKLTSGSNFIDTVVSSEELEPGNGWYYTGWLNSLAANPSMTSAQLGTAAVNAYGSYYASTGDVTLSATQTATASTLISALNTFAGDASLDWAIVTAARNASPYFYDQYDRDLKDFMSYIVSHTSNTTLAGDATAVVNAVNSTVLANFGKSTGNGAAGSLPTGMSIYLPSTTSSYSTYGTSNLAMLNAAPNWLGFVNALQGKAGGAVAAPTGKLSPRASVAVKIDGPVIIGTAGNSQWIGIFATVNTFVQKNNPEDEAAVA